MKKASEYYYKKDGKCIICGELKSYRNGKYCSIECRTIDWTGKKRPDALRRIKKVCPECKIEFEAGGRSGKKRDQIYCSNKCSGKSSRKSIDHFWDLNGRTKNHAWDKFRKEIFKRDNYTCKFCKEKKDKMQVHHIIPRKYGGNHLEKNLLTACRHCHGSIDRTIFLMVKNNFGKDPKQLIKRFMKIFNR